MKTPWPVPLEAFVRDLPDAAITRLGRVDRDALEAGTRQIKAYLDACVEASLETPDYTRPDWHEFRAAVVEWLCASDDTLLQARAARRATFRVWDALGLLSEDDKTSLKRDGFLGWRWKWGIV